MPRGTKWVKIEVDTVERLGKKTYVVTGVALMPHWWHGEAVTDRSRHVTAEVDAATAAELFKQLASAKRLRIKVDAAAIVRMVPREVESTPAWPTDEGVLADEDEGYGDDDDDEELDDEFR